LVLVGAEAVVESGGIINLVRLRTSRCSAIDDIVHGSHDYLYHLVLCPLAARMLRFLFHHGAAQQYLMHDRAPERIYPNVLLGLAIRTSLGCTLMYSLMYIRL
jgi:hypothetical protein